MMRKYFLYIFVNLLWIFTGIIIIIMRDFCCLLLFVRRYCDREGGKESKKGWTWEKSTLQMFWTD